MFCEIRKLLYLSHKKQTNGNEKLRKQGAAFPAGLRVLPTGNLGISQEIQPKLSIVPSTIVSDGGKSTLKCYKSNYLGLQVAYYLKNNTTQVNITQARFGIKFTASSQEFSTLGVTRRKPRIKRHPIM